MSHEHNAAITFAPLRVVPVASGAAYEVRTKQDDTPGSRNNFALCLCQEKAEADLFASAPDLLAACERLRDRLIHHTAEIESCDLPSGTELALEEADAAIAKAKGGAK